MIRRAYATGSLTKLARPVASVRQTRPLPYPGAVAGRHNSRSGFLQPTKVLKRLRLSRGRRRARIGRIVEPRAMAPGDFRGPSPAAVLGTGWRPHGGGSVEPGLSHANEVSTGTQSLPAERRTEMPTVVSGPGVRVPEVPAPESRWLPRQHSSPAEQPAVVKRGPRAIVDQPVGDDARPPRPSAELGSPSAAQAGRERATRAYFNQLFDEPLAGAAAEETLTLFGTLVSQFGDDPRAADQHLLRIARATAARFGGDGLRGTGADGPIRT